MKAKQVFEALTDILKPPTEETIKSRFSKDLGDVGEWLYNFQKTNKIFDLDIFTDDVVPFAEFSYQPGMRNFMFQLFKDKRLKVMPPKSYFYSSSIDIKNYAHFIILINDWLNGKYKRWEEELVKMTDQHFAVEE